ncbi:methyltransferase domain-containing protein [Acanthopleuribacter pedis]|uniref:Methyltransferase domain-containing protein n=1 Tax=Acanthopleuribacter pedis TaxID=442870 RepID=A0A8J7Q9X2_9BACT|nr:methyltransferase domain-containing protein [Acanthopleuribacter pedis]MBO1320457.1 methyltransferase domain-containing protein [Acanthopleuribacter pedis]
MTDPFLSAAHWEQVWQDADTRWDLGGVTPALIAFLRDTKVTGSVLVPGCGTGHDAFYWAKKGGHTLGVDFAPTALATAQTTYEHPRLSWEQADVRRLDFAARFDWIWEYTCFCALDPSDRGDYLDGIQRALKPGGTYLGMVFRQVTRREGPPFAVASEEFQEHLANRFEIRAYEETASHSIKPRRGREIWFEVKGKRMGI